MMTVKDITEKGIISMTDFYPSMRRIEARVDGVVLRSIFKDTAIEPPKDVIDSLIFLATRRHRIVEEKLEKARYQRHPDAWRHPESEAMIEDYLVNLDRDVIGRLLQDLRARESNGSCDGLKMAGVVIMIDLTAPILDALAGQR
jgi:hypothetical protein